MALPFQILKFDNLRGVESRKSLTAKNINDAEQAVGGFFDKQGAFVKRKGGEKYNTTSLSNRITGLYDFRYNGNAASKLIITAGTNIYEGNAGSPSSIKSGMTTNLIYDFTKYRVVDELFTSDKDFLFIVNGTDTPLKYDATTVTNLGIARPTTACAGSGSNGAGSLTNSGVYKVRYTFVSADGVESNPSDSVTVTLGGSDDTLDLTSVDVSTDAQVTKRFIYMTSNGGSTFTYNSTLNDNTSTTHTILAPSAGALLEYDHDAPPALKYIECGNDRLYGAKDNRFFFTKQYKPFYWPQGELDESILYYLDIGDGGPITGIKFFYNGCLIFKENGVWYFSGDDISPSLEQVKTDDLVGCVSNNTIIVSENYCYFLGIDGFYRTNGNIVENVSASISDSFNESSEETRFKINKSEMGKSCAVMDKENNLILFFSPTGSETENNMCFCVGLDNIASDGNDLSLNWSFWSGFTTSAAANIVESGRVKWFRGEENGYVFRQNALDGDGSNVNSTATAGAASTLTDSSQSWTVNLYSKLRVNIVSGTGSGQERIIASNTGTELTVSVAWDTVPDSTSVYTIGGPEYKYQHAWQDYGNPSLSKRWRWVRPRFDTTGNYAISFTFGYDFTEEDNDEQTTSLSSSSLWDTDLWDTAVWDGVFVVQTKFPLVYNRIHRWSSFAVSNQKAGQPITYNGHDKIFQMKGIR